MPAGTLEQRPLGRTGLSATPLGLGGVWLGHTPAGFREDVAVATVLRALDLGINLVDTSPSGYYAGGNSERWVGADVAAASAPIPESTWREFLAEFGLP